MADPPRNADTGIRPDPASAPAMPRWVKVAAIIVLVLAVLVVVVLLIGGGHGPPAGGHR